MEENEEINQKMGISSTGQAKNPQLKINLSEKLFEDETTLMNQETIKNLESFRKLTINRNENSVKNISDEELLVNLSSHSEEIIQKSFKKK